MANVLVVDDSYSMRQMIQFALTGGEHVTEQADDGVVALDIIAKKSLTFDLVITDINMPNMGGIELISEIRKIQEYKYTPILVLTTEASSVKKMRGKESGATGWIVKPFNPDTLLATVRKVI